MYSINDYVIYGTSGVCRIIDINIQKFNEVEREYYTIMPLYTKNSKIYVPVENHNNKLRNLLTADEIHTLIKTMPGEKGTWIKQNQQRIGRFKEIIKEGNREELARLISMLYLCKLDLAKAGKKLTMADEGIMKEAEKMLYEEFAFVLNIKLDEVVSYIRSEISS